MTNCAKEYDNKKIILTSSTTLILIAGVSNNVYAALASNAVLDFNDGVVSCVIGGTPLSECTYGITNVLTGSYFGMDTSDDQIIQNTERVALTNAGTGLTLGSAQGIGTIDVAWSFGGTPGNFYTKTGLPVAFSSGNAASVDMTGFTMNWNDGGIDLGNGALANNSTDHFATISCGIDCSLGDVFML